MNQQKIGEFLKCLRRESGLTQEQLAERFSVSSLYTHHSVVIPKIPRHKARIAVIFQVDTTCLDLDHIF